jgi:PTH1 family peptidyl-tRNA hydrolase
VSEGLLGRILHRGEHRERGARAQRIRLVVGLGNPGSEYAANRHNVGHWVMNRLARRHDMTFDHSRQVSLATGEIAGRKVTLAKPRTYVNESGKAVWNLAKRLKLDDAKELLVVYDELDLPLGQVRIRPSGSPGGHNGIKSIAEATGSDQFPRVRIGIGRPVVRGKPSWEPEHVANYVLSDPPPEDRVALDEAVERAMDAIELALADGIEAAMQQYN